MEQVQLTYRVFLDRQAGDNVPEFKELGPFESAEAAERAALAWLKAATPAPAVDAAGNLVGWTAVVHRGYDADELGFPLTSDEAVRRGDAEWAFDEAFNGAFLVQPQPPAVVAELNRRTEEMQRPAYREITGREPADAA